jgi:hypothetical protein
LSPAPQGTGSDWKNLPGTAQFLSTQTDRRTPCLLLYIRYSRVFFNLLFSLTCSQMWLSPLLDDCQITYIRKLKKNKNLNLGQD